MFKIVIFTTLLASAFSRPSPNLGGHPLFAAHGPGASLGHPGYYGQPGQGVYGHREHVLQALHELLTAKHLGLGPHGHDAGFGLRGYVGGYNGLNGGYSGFAGGVNGYGMGMRPVAPFVAPGMSYGSPGVPAAPSVKKVFNQVF